MVEAVDADPDDVEGIDEVVVASLVLAQPVDEDDDRLRHVGDGAAHIELRPVEGREHSFRHGILL